MLNLEEGFVAQVMSRRDMGLKGYEFNRVYGPDNRLDEGRSFWLITPLYEGDRPAFQQLSFTKYRAAQGRSAVSFDEFSAQDLAQTIIDGWMATTAQKAG